MDYFVLGTLSSSLVLLNTRVVLLPHPKVLVHNNLIVKTELPKFENFLKKLQRSWRAAKKSIEIAKTAIKKQFNKKRQNPQELKAEDNVWLQAKNIQLKQPSKKLDQKRYRLFKITKDIGQEVFQLKLSKG